MLPYTIILPILFFIVFIFAIFVSRNNRIHKLLNKKTSYSLEFATDLSKKDFHKALYNLVKDFKYNVEYVRIESNQYVLSDGISLGSWGFYYLFEYNNNKINLFLIPRFYFEINKFGLFNRRLEKISGLILLNK